jgi:NAD(P)-dependent dehydrogenase (short-subunit alcohol dehydrogenase family)
MTDRRSPGHCGPAPVVLLPDAIAADAARGEALALDFASQGWDIALHVDAAQHDAGHHAERVCDAVRRIGRRAAVLRVDRAGLAGAAGAAALLAQCAQVLGVPSCLVNVPLSVAFDSAIDSVLASAHDSAFDSPGETVGHGANGQTHASLAENDGSARLFAANLATPLALTKAFGQLWHTSPDAVTDADAVRTPAGTERSPSMVDACVINVIDSGIFDMDARSLTYLLTQSAVHAATPVLAGALAPSVRVVALATPMIAPAGREGVSDAALGEAMCYLARASTITGSTLLLDGGRHVHGPAAALRQDMSGAADAGAGAADIDKNCRAR